jgi:hypothetical protein
MQIMLERVLCLQLGKESDLKTGQSNSIVTNETDEIMG